jgi:hypothetical protein
VRFLNSPNRINNMRNSFKEKVANTSREIWIVNPFDQLPNETDVPLRYWAVCKTLAEHGHKVIWWSSDFNHLTKAKRESCADVDGFSVRLIETPTYAKNISLARLRNHKAFANGFYHEAMACLNTGELKEPERILVSLPPLGVAESAFRIRDHLNRRSEATKLETASCQVIVDIMDAWPEVFYQVIPKPLAKFFGPVILAAAHRSARLAYQGADKISGVGQSYLDLADSYLQRESKITKGSIAYPFHKKPMHLCYHGTDLSRFNQSTTLEGGNSEQTPHNSGQLLNKPTHGIERVVARPRRAVYLGSMGSGYDLQTIIDTAGLWRAEDIFPFQIHFAGVGPQLETLKDRASKLGLLGEQCDVAADKQSFDAEDYPCSILPPRVVFHGYLHKTAVNELLLSSDVALVVNRPDSLVACPYKAGEYAAASLPMISCLGGELGRLLEKWEAGAAYVEGNSESLRSAFKGYSDNKTLEQHASNAFDLAEKLFDRDVTYPDLAKFILS